MTDEHFAAAFRGLPRPDDAPAEPYRIMRILYIAYHAGKMPASEGAILRSFVARWDELPERDRNALRFTANIYLDDFLVGK